MQSQLLIDGFIFRRLYLFPWLWTGLEPKMWFRRAILGGPYPAGHLPISLSFHPESSALV